MSGLAWESRVVGLATFVRALQKLLASVQLSKSNFFNPWIEYFPQNWKEPRKFSNASQFYGPNFVIRMLSWCDCLRSLGRSEFLHLGLSIRYLTHIFDFEVFEGSRS